MTTETVPVPDTKPPLTDQQAKVLAFKLGCNVTTAKRLYEEGLIS